jgi:arsenate reductase
VSEAHRPYNVLFVCTGNSARSIMAEALMNRLGGGRFKAWSAGPSPIGTINPHLKPVLESLGYEPGDFRSKSWDEFAGPGAPPMDFIFTLCADAAGEVLPEWQGHPMTAHWTIADPIKASGHEAEVSLIFDEVGRQLHRRIGVFIELPFDKLDRILLQSHLHEIGALETQAAS